MSSIAYLPMWAVCLIWTTALSFVALVGLACVRLHPNVTRAGLRFHNELVGCYFAAVAVFYGVTLGLITASVWNNYAEAEKAVGLEAAAIDGLFRTAGELPRGPRVQIQGDALDYARWVEQVVWPKQHDGSSTPGDDRSIDTLQRDILAEHTRTGDCTVNSEMISRLNELVAARQTRVNWANISIPSVMWWFVGIGAVLTLAPSWFFTLEKIWPQALLSVLLSMLMGMSISLVMLLDNPLHGAVSIHADAYDSVKRSMEAAVAADRQRSSAAASSAP